LYAREAPRSGCHLIDPQPTTLSGFLNKDDGTVDLHLSVSKETAEYTQRMLSIDPAELIEPMKEVKTRKRRADLEFFDDNNQLQKVMPYQSSWFLIYVQHLELSERFRRKF
jgi:hypothetical protein